MSFFFELILLVISKSHLNYSWSFAANKFRRTEEEEEEGDIMIGFIMNGVMYKPIVLILVYTCIVSIHQTVLTAAQNGDGKEGPRTSDECQVTPVIHVLQYPGCVPKPIPSFACIGRCSSYLQVIFKYFFLKIWSACPKWCAKSNLRYPVVKYGKWNDHVCVARNQVNEKLLFHCFVRKPNQARENSVKYVLDPRSGIQKCEDFAHEQLKQKKNLFHRFQQRLHWNVCVDRALVLKRHRLYHKKLPATPMKVHWTIISEKPNCNEMHTPNK